MLTVTTWRLQPILQALVSVEVLSSLIKLGSLPVPSTTSWESHFPSGQDWFCWKRCQRIRFYFDSSIACEMATDAAEDLVCLWVSNAEVVDAWSIFWSVVLLRLIILSSSLQFLIPLESSWMAKRTDRNFRKTSPSIQLFLLHKSMLPSPACPQLLSAVRAENCLCSLS